MVFVLFVLNVIIWGLVTLNNNNFHFKCTHCYEQKIKSVISFDSKTEEHCATCGRYFRIVIPEEKKQFKILKVSCPYCEEKTLAKV